MATLVPSMPTKYEAFTYQPTNPAAPPSTAKKMRTNSTDKGVTTEVRNGVEGVSARLRVIAAAVGVAVGRAVPPGDPSTFPTITVTLSLPPLRIARSTSEIGRAH